MLEPRPGVGNSLPEEDAGGEQGEEVSVGDGCPTPTTHEALWVVQACLARRLERERERAVGKGEHPTTSISAASVTPLWTYKEPSQALLLPLSYPVQALLQPLSLHHCTLHAHTPQGSVHSFQSLQSGLHIASCHHSRLQHWY